MRDVREVLALAPAPRAADRADAVVGAAVAVAADEREAVAEVDQRRAAREPLGAVGRVLRADQRVHQVADRRVARVLVVRDVGDREVLVEVGRADAPGAGCRPGRQQDVVPLAHRRGAEHRGADHGQREGAVRCGDRDLRGVERRRDDDRALVVDQVDEAAEVAQLAGDDQARAGRRRAVGARVRVVDRDDAADVDVVLGLADRAGLRSRRPGRPRGRPW